MRDKKDMLVAIYKRLPGDGIRPIIVEIDFDKYNPDVHKAVNGIPYPNPKRIAKEHAIEIEAEEVEAPELEAPAEEEPGEEEASQDPSLICECGKECASVAGLKAHQRSCKNKSEDTTPAES